MNTYIFSEKNGSGSLIMSADNEEEAREYLKETLKYPEGWRLSEVEKE